MQPLQWTGEPPAEEGSGSRLLADDQPLSPEVVRPYGILLRQGQSRLIRTPQLSLIAEGRISYFLSSTWP